MIDFETVSLYDPLGYQISSTFNGQTTSNLIDPYGLGNVMAQFDSSGNLVAHYTFGLGLVSQVTPSDTPSYYDFNALGSTTDLTNSTGGLVATYSYLPFGGLLASTGSVSNPFTFAGQYGISSDGSGLYDMRARSYDPSTGQFVSNDPIGLGGGDTDLRRYAGNNPVEWVDPSGMNWSLPNVYSEPALNGARTISVQRRISRWHVEHLPP